MDKLMSLRSLWSEGSPLMKIGAAVALSGLLSLLVVLAWGAKHPTMVPLTAGQPLEEVSRITGRLDELGVTYELAGNGSTVLVEEAQRQRLRVELAGAGMLFKEAPGFELFENSQLQRSDFSERVTYLRALQGELTDTISALPEVQSARVHLNIPKETLFLNESTVPTAAVYLQTRPGMRLSKAQVAGILHLVAGSIDGLEPKNVTLMDENGPLHLSGEDLEDDARSGDEQKDPAEALGLAGQGLVDRILGPGRAVVRVQVQYDEDSSHIERETVEPVSAGRGIPISQEDAEESYVGTRKGGTEEGGGVVAVTEPNANANTEKPSYQQRSNKVQYEINRVREVIERRRGRIARITASVLVDANLKLTPQELTSLSDGVKGAVGFSVDRGDSFSLQAVSFRRDFMEDLTTPAAVAAQPSPMSTKVMALIGALILLIVIAVVLYAVARRRKAAKVAEEGRETVWIDVDQNPLLLEPPALEEPSSSIDLTLGAELPYLEPLMDRESLLREVGAIAAEHPDLVARIIERWLTE